MNYPHKLAAAHRVVIYVWVFALVLALFPLTANPVKPIKELITALCVLGLALSLLARPPKVGEAYDWQRMPMLLVAGLWLLWGLVCASFSGFLMTGLDELRTYLGWLLVAFFAARVFREPRHINQLFLVVCTAVFLSSVYGFLQYFGHDPFPWSSRDIEEYRGLPSTYANPNFAGHTLILALIAGGGLLAVKRMRWVIVFMALIAAHLYQTHMRGAPLALAGGCLVLACAWFAARKVRAGFTAKVCFTFGAVILVGLAGMGVLLPVSKVRTGFYFPTDGSLILRYNGYYGAARMVADHPVMGVGPGNFGRQAIAYWTPYEKRWFADQQKRNMRVHFDLLETAVEGGLPGLALHMMLYMVLLVRSLSLAFTSDDPDKRRIGYTCATFFAAFIVDGFFGFNLRVPVSAGLFFLMAGALEGLMAPTPPPVVLAAADMPKKKKKHKLQEEAVLDLDAQPRVFSSLLVCAGAAVCTIFAVVVLAGEMQYQKGTAARLAAESTTNTTQQGYALRNGDEALSSGSALVFWDERYPDLQGHLAMRMGDTEAAIRHYTRALEYDPHHPHKASNLARAYLTHGLKLAREEKEADYTQVAVLLEQAQYFAEQSERYCAVSPYVQDVVWRVARALAVLAEEQGRDEIPYWLETEQRLQQCLAYGTRDVPGVYRALGAAYVKLNRLEDAFGPFERILRDNPTDEPTWMLFEDAARDLKKEEPFIKAVHGSYPLVLKNIKEKEDAFVALLRRMVVAHDELRGDPRAATRLLRYGVMHTLSRSEPWALLAGLAASQGNTNILCRDVTNYLKSEENRESIPVFAQSACTGVENIAALGASSHDLARTAMQYSGHSMAKIFGGAADFLTMLLERGTPEASIEAGIRANLATVYLEAGRWASADDNFAYAIPHLPESGKGRLLAARSRAIAGLGQMDEAMKMIGEAVSLAPNDPLVQLTYARHLRSENRLDEAAFAYQAAVNTLPEQSPLRTQALREAEQLRSVRKSSQLNLDS